MNYFVQFACKSIINPRTDQATYSCPHCHHQENADYQASYQIGRHFMVGMNLKSQGIDKNLGEEIAQYLIS
jgi:predicted RNA-binding Zn-ribbon protein involved in translation (DUF1610 family)